MSNVIEFEAAASERATLNRDLPTPAPKHTVQELVEMSYLLERSEPEEERPRCARPETTTQTGKNARTRLERRAVWWKMERRLNYWRARMDLEGAIPDRTLRRLRRGQDF